MIAHNGDNYTHKRYSMIYLDDNNKENIKKNQMKLMKKNNIFKVSKQRNR